MKLSRLSKTFFLQAKLGLVSDYDTTPTLVLLTSVSDKVVAFVKFWQLSRFDESLNPKIFDTLKRLIRGL